jgi:hypothetical protein
MTDHVWLIEIYKHGELEGIDFRVSATRKKAKEWISSSDYKGRHPELTFKPVKYVRADKESKIKQRSLFSFDTPINPYSIPIPLARTTLNNLFPKLPKELRNKKEDRGLC